MRADWPTTASKRGAWRRSGFALGLFQPAVTGTYPSRAPRLPLVGATAQMKVPSTPYILAKDEVAYTGEIVTWEKLMASTVQLDGNLKGLKT